MARKFFWSASLHLKDDEDPHFLSWTERGVQKQVCDFILQREKKRGTVVSYGFPTDPEEAIIAYFDGHVEWCVIREVELLR